MSRAATMTTSDLTETSMVSVSSNRWFSTSMVGYTRLKELRQSDSKSRITSWRKNETPIAEIRGMSRGAWRSGR